MKILILTKQFYRRLTAKAIQLRHVQIINEHNYLLSFRRTFEISLLINRLNEITTKCQITILNLKNRMSYALTSVFVFNYDVDICLLSVRLGIKLSHCACQVM